MPSSDLNRIVKGAGILFIGIIISKLFSYIYRLAIARIGVDEYGLFSLGLSIIGIITSIALLGLHRGVLRYVSYYRGKEDLGRVKGVIISALSIGSITSVILSIILFLMSDFISLNFFHNISLSPILKILAISIPISIIHEIINNTIIGFQQIKYLVISKNIVLNVAKVFLTIIFIYFSKSIIGITSIYVISFLISLILSYYYLEFKIFPILKSKVKSIKSGMELFSFSWPLVFSSFALLVVGWSDTIMIGLFKTVKDVGIYNTALPTAQTLYTIPQALTFLVVPTLTYLLSKENIDEFKIVYQSATKWIFMINAILFSLFILFPKQIISVLFGGQYAGAWSSLVILSIGLFLHYSFILTVYIPSISNKTKLEMINFSTAALINIILNLILIPIYGIVGAAIATSISFMIAGLMYFIEGLKIIKINPLKSVYINILISILLTSAIVLFLSKNYIDPNNMINLIILSIIFIVIYTVALILTRCFEKEDIEVMHSIERKIGLKTSFVEKFL